MKFLLPEPSALGKPQSGPPAPDDKSSVAQAAARRIEAWLAEEKSRRTIVEQAGQIAIVAETGGGECRYRYDSRGDLAEIIEADGSRLLYAYDERRRLVRAHQSDGSETSYVYENDRLISISDGGTKRSFRYDVAGRPVAIERGDAGAAVFRYDDQGRVIEARTGRVATGQAFDAAGRLAATRQTIDGVMLETRSEFDAAGRLATLSLPGGAGPIRYTWDARGRPAAIALGDRPIAHFEYDEPRTTRIRYANGVVETSESDRIDGRPVSRRVERAGEILFEQRYVYGPAGEIVDDGARSYEYDPLGRLIQADAHDGSARWRYGYDQHENRTEVEDTAGVTRFEYAAGDRLVRIEDAGGTAEVTSDRSGRPVRRTAPSGEWSYRFNDAGHLIAVRHRGETAGRFTYDHKGRLVLAERDGRIERYLYGPDDALLAVTDEAGRPLRLIIRTPLGPLAEVPGPLGGGQVHYLHHDHRGTCHLVTDASGAVAARFRYCPFGAPLGDTAAQPVLPSFGGRTWDPELGLYYVGARWYEPRWGRFLTPDSYTAAPDDERLVHPLWSGRRQVASRTELLGAWLKQPRRRNRYAYCANDPLNRADPTGHWSFGGVLLMLLGAIWTLPNTLFGLLLEITCLIGEVVRWLVWLISFGHVSWETPGFDVAASGRLNAFALVFSGGWLGSFPSLLGITFGNVFFVYKQWPQHPHASGTGVVFPPAYNGQVSIPKNEALYEHELRHTNQYGWFGPFFHLGLPIFGVYEWDVILNGYTNAWLERDAREHGGL